ncbi:MAG: futalosine hydrolase [Chitinophagaceae bacterium]
MNCLIIAATSVEISPFLEQYRNKCDLPANINIDVLVTGIGLTATTYSLIKQINIKRPQIILQAGIGGGFEKSIPLGTVLAVKQDRFADLGVSESGKWKTLSDLGLLAANKYPFSKEWLVNKSELLKKVNLKKVNAVSVNEITTSIQKINLYNKIFNPAVESMEGAALHYVCLLEKIPFLQIRSISNYIGERNKKKWKIKDSIINMNNELVLLLNIL